MTRRLFGLATISFFLISCSSTNDNSTNISSLDSVKKYIEGTWLQSDDHTTSEYNFIKDFRGLRTSGMKQDKETITIQSNPDGFELVKENDTVRIKLISMHGRTSSTIKHLSEERLVIDQREYHKINYR